VRKTWKNVVEEDDDDEQGAAVCYGMLRNVAVPCTPPYPGRSGGDGLAVQPSCALPAGQAAHAVESPTSVSISAYQGLLTCEAQYDIVTVCGCTNAVLAS